MALTMGNPGKSSESTVSGGYVYRFGHFALDSRKRTLSRANSPVVLTSKAFDVLLYLAQNPNRLVTKDELLEAVWHDAFVEEGSLTQYISHLRKALGDNSEDTRLIVTIARKGYQFTAEVTIGELPKGEIQSAVPFPTPEVPQSHKLPKVEGQVSERKSGGPPITRRIAAILGACVVILVVAGYISWRPFRDPTPARPEKVMLAVLPFDNLTGDPGKEYLADGLTEETISQLSRLDPERLGVIARTSVMGYKHKDVRLDQIGRELSVQYVLENSLRENADHVRLTTQLIRLKDQTHLWSQNYDYAAKDTLKIEDEVAEAVARQIQLRLSPEQRAELARQQTVNPEAFDAYLQGHYYFERNTDKDTDMAAKYFERATQVDPSYALAWARLSRARNWQAEEELIPKVEGRRLSREAVERALALNPNLSEAHIQMARIKRFVDFDWVGADASIQRAITLEPGNSDALIQAAGLAAQFGRSDEAIASARRAVELDPLNADSWSMLAETRYFNGQFVGAEADVKKWLEWSRDAWPGPVLLSRLYVLEGRPQDALPQIELVRSDSSRVWLYAITYHALGQEKQSDAALQELIAKYGLREAFEVAMVYAIRNQREEAFAWLDRAYAQRDSNVVYTNLLPELKNLHSDARFAAFLKKAHLRN